jgi:hypothetical protein
MFSDSGMEPSLAPRATFAARILGHAQATAADPFSIYKYNPRLSTSQFRFAGIAKNPALGASGPDGASRAIRI